MLRGLMLSAAAAAGLCAVPMVFAQIDAARHTTMAGQDAELNDAYRAALQRSAATAREELRDGQRRWLQGRNETCGLTQREAASPVWPQNLTPEKADCVMRITNERLSALRVPAPAPEALPVTPVTGFYDSDRLLSLKEYVFPMGRNSGKWYAEIQVQKNLAARKGTGQLQVGIDNVDGFYALTGDVHPGDDNLETFALAIDLDDNSMWWRTAVGGTRPRVPLAKGTKPYGLKVKSDVELQAALARGLIRINHGQRPFTFPMPAGYMPWYAPQAADEPSRWITPAYERIEGMDRKDMAKAYWNWLLDREPSQNPALDRTGAACAVKQGEKVWYLAGAALGDRIERKCVVPAGVPLVIPVMAILLQFDNPRECEANIRVATLAPFTLQNTFLEIDGKRFDRLQDYSAAVEQCGPFQAAGKLLSRNALWLGMWVPLRPLPRGEHVVSFGGRFNAMDTDRHVTYRLTVQ